MIRDGASARCRSRSWFPATSSCLDAGDLVPADCRLIEARDLSVDEAPLTGKSFPVEKHARDLAAAAEGASGADNAIFLATTVVTGSARAVVA